MRVFWISLGGLLAAACSLSMNPDLPSAENEDSGGFTGDGDGSIGLGDGDGDGDGIFSPPTGEGEGGAPHCDAMGGAGGAQSTCKDSP